MAKPGCCSWTGMRNTSSRCPTLTAKVNNAFSSVWACGLCIPWWTCDPCVSCNSVTSAATSNSHVMSKAGLDRTLLKCNMIIQAHLTGAGLYWCHVTWMKCSVCPVGILYGTMTLELGGKVTIECEKTKCFLELEFKLKVLFLLVS